MQRMTRVTATLANWASDMEWDARWYVMLIQDVFAALSNGLGRLAPKYGS